MRSGSRSRFLFGADVVEPFTVVDATTFEEDEERVESVPESNEAVPAERSEIGFVFSFLSF